VLFCGKEKGPYVPFGALTPKREEGGGESTGARESRVKGEIAGTRIK